VDVMTTTPATVQPPLEAGKVSIIGLAPNTRLKGSTAHVPTFKEQVIDVLFDIPRGFIGPRALSADQVRYWDGVFSRMVKSDHWKQAAEKNQWVELYMTNGEFGEELRRQHRILKDVLGELGLVH